MYTCIYIDFESLDEVKYKLDWRTKKERKKGREGDKSEGWINEKQIWWSWSFILLLSQAYSHTNKVIEMKQNKRDMEAGESSDFHHDSSQKSSRKEARARLKTSLFVIREAYHGKHVHLSNCPLVFLDLSAYRMTFADHLHACSIESVHMEINEQIVFPLSNGLPRGSVCPSELFRHDEYRGMISREEELMQWMMSVPLFYSCREAWRWSEKEMTSLHQLCSSRRIRDACRSTIATRTSVGWHDVVHTLSTTRKRRDDGAQTHQLLMMMSLHCTMAE